MADLTNSPPVQAYGGDGPSPFGGPGAQVIQMGAVRGAGLAVVLAEERAKSQITQAQPVVGSLAGHIRKCWTQARDARQQTIEPKMLSSVRQRRGEYDPDKLQAIRSMGGSELFANLTSVKCRAASSWLRDVLMSTGDARPWAIKPTPLPDLPANVNEMILQLAVEPIKQAAMAGVPMDQNTITQMMADMRDQAKQAAYEDARRSCERMADKMEDQLYEGGFIDALDQFIDDLVTFPAAFIKGPIVRKKPKLTWSKDKQPKPIVTNEIVLEWERVSPFNIFPAPSSSSINDGYLIERHQLSRQDLNEMIDVEGYDNATIRTVLDDYGRGGLHEWLVNDMEQATAEGKSSTAVASNTEGLIDALQFWGSVQGKMLVEWGLDEEQIPDQTKEYHVEAWLIGPYVIKASLNYDPLCRKPFYKASYEDIPGAFWGNSVADLVRDVQDVVNAAGRAIVNNMAMSSGPQIAINVDRVPPGEDLTTMQPWRIWQVSSDQYGNSGQPVAFFQPQSNAAELMAIYEKFSELGDEYSGIPRYLTGDTTGGAGRTASGLSMLISNAGKSIKQVVSNVDFNVMKPLLERLYFYNMQYSEDPDLKGDVQVVAAGAAALIAKDGAQVRRNEFLAATANPLDAQIIGPEGRAAILRETAKSLDMDVDKIIPPVDTLKRKLAELQQQMAMQAQQAAQGAGPGVLPGANNAPIPGGPSNSGQTLQDGTPITDNFSPPRQ